MSLVGRPKALTAGNILAALIGAGTLTAGSLLYGQGTAQPATLAIGAAGTVLTSSGTAPQWSTSLALSGTVRVASAGAGAFGVVTQDETSPSTIASWSNKHSLLAGVGTSSTGAALAASMTYSSGAASLIALLPGTTWLQMQFHSSDFQWNTGAGAGASSAKMTLSNTGILSLSSSAASTSTTTGALVVTGGAGIGGALNVGLGGIFGSNSGAIELRVNGGNSGSDNGGRVSVWNNGSSILQFGNKSAILGGAYDATPYFYSNGVVQFADGARSIHATGGIGYGTGAGGTVTQATSKATGVTLNKVCGTITLHNAALAAGTAVSFTFTNSAIAAGDQVIVQHDSVGTLGAYLCVAGSAAGSATVTVRNNSGGSLSEAIVLRFTVFKAVTA